MENPEPAEAPESFSNGDDGGTRYDPTSERFLLGDQALEVLLRISRELRAKLPFMTPYEMAQAAIAIVIINRLPRVTPDAYANVSYRSERNANGGWSAATFEISDASIQLTTMTRGYGEYGGDTNSQTVWWAVPDEPEHGTVSDWTAFKSATGCRVLQMEHEVESPWREDEE